MASITYDVEKLLWLNQQWLQVLDLQQLAQYALPFITAAYPNACLTSEQLVPLLTDVRRSCRTLKDFVEQLRFYFEPPSITPALFKDFDPVELRALATYVEEHLADFTEWIFETVTDIPPTPEQLAATGIKKLSHVYQFLRIAWTGLPKGLSVKHIVPILGIDESKRRLMAVTRIVNDN